MDNRLKVSENKAEYSVKELIEQLENYKYQYIGVEKIMEMLNEVPAVIKVNK